MAEYLTLSSLSKCRLHRRLSRYLPRYKLVMWVEEPYWLFFTLYRANMRRVGVNPSLELTVGPVVER